METKPFPPPISLVSNAGTVVMQPEIQIMSAKVLTLHPDVSYNVLKKRLYEHQQKQEQELHTQDTFAEDNS